MTDDRWRLANAHFEQIVELPSDQRQTALEQLCGDDSELLSEVEELLRADAAASDHDFLGQAPQLMLDAEGTLEWDLEPNLLDPDFLDPDLDSSHMVPMVPPERLGAYRIIEEIGSGGMGTIFAAERDDGTMDQKVAIKVIRAGAENKDIVRRMRMERRILARLQHPHIARIYDAGSTETGLPYFVMELVDGLPIDQFCAQNKLDLHARLRLVRKVCTAVEYANERLVVHRDLKPSNILVTSEGEPKLLDFGIAKVLETEHRDDRAQTRTEPWRRRLTLEFASPEQIRGQPVSMGCDVYSLGVLLYLLLTDRLPRPASSVTPWLFNPRLRHTDPPRPSVAVLAPPEASGPSTSQGRRKSRRLSGDLDSIILGALQEDTRSRYTSAKELGEDLDRYLAGFPVQARHGSVGYRLSKFLRRHKYAALFIMTVLALSSALLGSRLQANAQKAQSRALLEVENQKSRRILDMLLGIFEQAGPLISDGVHLSLREAVDRYLATSTEDLEDQPQVQAAVLNTLGWIYLDLGEPTKALEFLEDSLGLHRSLVSDPEAEMDSLVGLAAAKRELFDLKDAEKLGTLALQRLEALPGVEPLQLLKALNHHVELLCLKEDWPAADPFSRRAHELSQSLADESSGEIHAAAAQRARVLRRLGKVEAAHELYSATISAIESVHQQEHPMLAVLYNNLGEMDYKNEDFESAVDRWQQAEDHYRNVYGADYYDRVWPLYNLGNALAKMQRLDEAEERFRQAIEVAQQSPALQPSHESLYFGRPAVKLARLMRDGGRCREALELLEPKYQQWKKGWARRNSAELVAQCRGRLNG